MQNEPIKTEENYGGLGKRYLAKLYENIDRLHQVDIVTGVTESNGSVRTRAIQLALELKKKAVQPNDVICICSRCHRDQTIVMLATLFICGVVAPLDPDLINNECKVLLKNLKPKLCFCDTRALKQIDRILNDLNMSCQLIHFGEDQQDAVSFKKLLSSSSNPPPEFTPKHIEYPKKTVAFILHTQKSNKLVCVSHHFVYVQTLIFLKICNYPDKIISFFPLSWIMQTILACMCFESPVIRILTGDFSERNCCKIIQDLKVDCAFLGTDLASRLADNVAIRDFNLRSLRYMIIGNLTTTHYDMRSLSKVLPMVKFLQIYYTTETGCAIATLPSDYEEILDRSKTVGKVLPGYEIKVVDYLTRKKLGPGFAGEIIIKGDCMMLGYFKDMTLTELRLDNDGFFKTGDIGKIDQKGWVFIQGPMEDFISINGMTFSPNEIEDVILLHPFVKDVVVIGNEKEIVACVVVKKETHLDDERLMSFIADKLPSLKSPKKIIFMDNFPRTSIGKIKRHILRNDIFNIKIELSKSLETCQTLTLEEE